MFNFNYMECVELSRLKHLLRFSVSVTVMLLMAGFVHSSDLAVVYPSVREPYSRVYSDIIAGIQSEYDGSVQVYSVNGDMRALQEPLGGSLEPKPQAVVALGNKSLESVYDICFEKFPLFATLVNPTDLTGLAGGVLLKPGASTYLTQLLAIYPQVGTVHVVYTPSKHQKLIEDARQFLGKHNKKIDAIPVANVRESARGLRDIVRLAKEGDAIWLISDSGLIDVSLLDLVLDAAWEKRLAVFSSNPVFVKRGALFAIYPDNRGLGRRLAEIVMESARNNFTKEKFENLKNVHVAYNERTGKHIGIKLTPEYREGIDLILPEQ